MKKIAIVVLFMFMTTVITFAENWSSTKDFQAYKGAKAIAKDADMNGNSTVAVIKYLEAASIAKGKTTPVIEGWQRNNAAYVLIKSFKINKEKSLLVEAMTYLTDAEIIVNELLLKASNENIEPMNEVLNLKSKVDSNINFCKVKLEN